MSMSARLLMRQAEDPTWTPEQNAQNRLSPAEVMQELKALGIERRTRRVLVFGVSRSGKSELINVMLEAASSFSGPAGGSFRVGSTLKAVTTGMNRGLLVMHDNATGKPDHGFIFYNTNGLLDAEKDNRERNNAENLEAVKDCSELPAIVMFVLSPDPDTGATTSADRQAFQAFANLMPEVGPGETTIVVNQIECDAADINRATAEFAPVVFRNLGVPPELATDDQVFCVGDICNGPNAAANRADTRRRLLDLLERSHAIAIAAEMLDAGRLRTDAEALEDQRDKDAADHAEKKEERKKDLESKAKKCDDDVKKAAEDAQKEIEVEQDRTNSAIKAMNWTAAIAGTVLLLSTAGGAASTGFKVISRVSSKAANFVVSGLGRGIIGGVTGGAWKSIMGEK